MSSKYMPPHLRNKPTETTDEVPKQSEPLSNNKKTFASLAANWAKETEDQKIMDDAKKQDLNTFESIRKNRLHPLPQFHNIRHFVEPEDDECQEEPEKKPGNPDQEGWVEVRYKRKYRKVKTLEDDEEERPPSPEEKQAEETVWTRDEEQEDTYWKH